MQFKKFIKLTILMGIITLGGTYFLGQSVHADIKNEFPRIKKDRNLNGNDLKLKKFNSSKVRSNKYKLISRSTIKTRLFFQKSGNFYSKHLGTKYLVNRTFLGGSWNQGYSYYADSKEKLYNKKTKQYNTYYHLSTLNGKNMGWTWDKNLVAYQSSNTKLNKTIRSIFPGAKVNSDLQYLVNMGEIGSYSPDYVISDNPYYDYVDDITNSVNDSKSVAFRLPYRQSIAPMKFERKYLNQLKKGTISYKYYANKVINHDPNLRKKAYKGYQIGVLSYPKSSPRYGYFSLILEKR